MYFYYKIELIQLKICEFIICIIIEYLGINIVKKDNLKNLVRIMDRGYLYV